MLFDFAMSPTYVPRRVKSEGLVHWLVSPVSLAIYVMLESSVVCRLQKSLMRLASVRQASILGKTIT
jgi:hypothetical protein